MDNIKNGNISIRKFDKNDYIDYYRIFMDSEVHKYLSSNAVVNIEEAKSLINKEIENYEDGFMYKLAVCLEDKLIGYIGLSKYNLMFNSLNKYYIDKCEVVYAIGKEYWHKGLMGKALTLFCNYLLKERKTKVIIATHIKENINSGKVMLKSGFIRNELLDRDMVIKGEVVRLVGYELRKD